jgi:hypothetical protein
LAAGAVLGAIGSTLKGGGFGLDAFALAGDTPLLAVAGSAAIVTGTALQAAGAAQISQGLILMNQNQAQPDLQILHSNETTLSSNRSSYDFWSSKSTQEIIDSLTVSGTEPLTVKANGTVMQGNTRILILQERGVNVNSLPRAPYP